MEKITSYAKEFLDAYGERYDFLEGVKTENDKIAIEVNRVRRLLKLIEVENAAHENLIIAVDALLNLTEESVKKYEEYAKEVVSLLEFNRKFATIILKTFNEDGSENTN